MSVDEGAALGTGDRVRVDACPSHGRAIAGRWGIEELQSGARIGQQDQVKCCYALQTKLWVPDPDQTLWEVCVLHDDVPNWGEKDKKVKLRVTPLKAFGIWGVIRRAAGPARRGDPDGNLPDSGPKSSASPVSTATRSSSGGRPPTT